MQVRRRVDLDLTHDAFLVGQGYQGHQGHQGDFHGEFMAFMGVQCAFPLSTSLKNVGIISNFGGREKNCDVILEGLEIPGRTTQKNRQHVSLIRLSLGSAWPLRKMASRYHCILQCKAWFVDKVKAQVWRALRLDHKATYKA